MLSIRLGILHLVADVVKRRPRGIVDEPGTLPGIPDRCSDDVVTHYKIICIAERMLRTAAGSLS